MYTNLEIKKKQANKKRYLQNNIFLFLQKFQKTLNIQNFNYHNIYHVIYPILFFKYSDAFTN